MAPGAPQQIGLSILVVGRPLGLLKHALGAHLACSIWQRWDSKSGGCGGISNVSLEALGRSIQPSLPLGS